MKAKKVPAILSNTSLSKTPTASGRVDRILLIPCIHYTHLGFPTTVRKKGVDRFISTPFLPLLWPGVLLVFCQLGVWGIWAAFSCFKGEQQKRYYCRKHSVRFYKVSCITIYLSTDYDRQPDWLVTEGPSLVALNSVRRFRFRLNSRTWIIMNQIICDFLYYLQLNSAVIFYWLNFYQYHPHPFFSSTPLTCAYWLQA